MRKIFSPEISRRAVSLSVEPKVSRWKERIKTTSISLEIFNDESTLDLVVLGTNSDYGHKLGGNKLRCMYLCLGRGINQHPSLLQYRVLEEIGYLTDQSSFRWNMGNDLSIFIDALELEKTLTLDIFEKIPFVELEGKKMQLSN